MQRENETIETKVEKGFILIEERRYINDENYSSCYDLLDSNRNYVNSLGKKKYAQSIIEAETSELKTEEELEKWYLNQNRNISELKDQDKRNLISMADFTLHAHNSLEFYYYLRDNQNGNLGGIEEEKFSNIDEIIERLDTYLSEYFHVDREFE